MLEIRNKKNGHTSEISPEDWKELKANPLYNGLFELTSPEPTEPEEVKEIKARKAAKPKEVKAEPAVTEQPSEN